MDSYNKIFSPFSKIIQNDSIYVVKYVPFDYDFALCYIILYIRTSDMRKNISRKILKNLNLRQKTEAFTKRNLVFIEVTY